MFHVCYRIYDQYTDKFFDDFNDQIFFVNNHIFELIVDLLRIAVLTNPVCILATAPPLHRLHKLLRFM